MPSASITPTMIVLPSGEPLATLTWEAVTPGPEARSWAEYLKRRTDKYFTKSREIIEKFGDRTVTYGVFLRRGVICAVNPAIDVLRSYYPAKAEPLRITRLYEEGAFVPDQKALFTYTGSF